MDLLQEGDGRALVAKGITSAQDKVSSISTILCRDLLTGFEEKIEELTTSTNDTGERVTIALTDKTVEEG